MNERELHKEIVQDLRIGGGRVLYLEGRSDVPAFLALLGHADAVEIPDEGRVHQKILVRGLRAHSGSGGNSVRQRVHVAEKFGYRGVRGLVDGDGELLSDLAPCFDAPFAGQLHRWKAYCIENLLPQVGWPVAWGPEPDWRETLRGLLPYAALNRAIRVLQRHLSDLGVAKFVHPPQGQALRTVEDIERQLGADVQAFRGGIDALEIFRAAVAVVAEALAGPALLQAHALVSGKWLVEVCAPKLAHRPADECRRIWIHHVARAGGHPEVRAWWDRYLAL